MERLHRAQAGHFYCKNYLEENEIDTLNRLTVIFLETAELRAKNHVDTTMDFWRNNANQLIESNQFTLLQDKGAVSNTQMEQLALSEYEKFDNRRKTQDAEIADRQDEKELKELETKRNNRDKVPQQ